MQDTQAAIPHWAYTVLQTLATLGAGGLIVKLIDLYQNRRKPTVEIHKTEAETTEIIVRSHAAAGDAMGRMMDRWDAAAATADRLRAERNDLREKCEDQDRQIEAYERQLGRMKRYMEDNNLDFNDLIVKKS